MIASLSYDTDRKEIAELVFIWKDLAAKLSGEEWRIITASSPEELRSIKQSSSFLDMIIFDIRDKKSIEIMRQLRSCYKTASVLLIVDANISPMDYLRPDIMASSLILRPFSVDQVQAVFYEFMCSCLEKRGSKNERQHSYIVETREGTFQIPYDQILFFEARNKKIYLCTNKEEFGFYGTIDNLVDELPDRFIRCHRSFLVNSSKIRKIMISRNLIYLTDGFDVPLSRSYKPALKEYAKNER